MYTSTASFRANEDEDYARLVRTLNQAIHAGPLFTTDATDLYETFLANIPPGSRQHYECRTCKKFVNTYGGLVTIDEHGGMSSPFWNVAGGFFAAASRALLASVRSARVTGVFLSSETYWGTASNSSSKAPTGMWSHMHANARAVRYSPSPVKDAFQASAEKTQDYETLSRSFGEFGIEHVRQAYTLLTNGFLFRSEKCIGVAKWLLDLHESRARSRNTKTINNVTWRAVATAPAGFCHVRSTMIGTLLEGLAAGKDMSAIKHSFDSKMNPMQYQRPTAAPSSGQITEAERVVQRLASAGSLARRFATFEDIVNDALWIPKPVAAERNAGVFAHLRKDEPANPLDVNSLGPITWEKFWRTVLPEAERIECLVPSGLAPFFAFVTAVNPDAPPILQWDREGSRNPVSWYLHTHGSSAVSWALSPGMFVNVTVITSQPSNWGGGAEHQGNGVYLVLKGARDITNVTGCALFPEILKAEYHGIRHVIEAHSNASKLEGAKEASACGLALQKSAGVWKCIVRVTSKGVRALYTLDRWD